MSEPGLLSQLEAAKQESLWERAPAWRGLTVAASSLTLAAVATPLLLPQPIDTSFSPHVVPSHVAASPIPNVPMIPKAVIVQPVHPAPARAASLTHQAVPQAIPQSGAHVEQHAVTPPVETASLPAQSAPTAEPTICTLTLSTQAQPMGGGVVIGYENPIAAQQRVRANEQALGAPVNPIFALTPRAVVRTDGGSPGAPNQIVVVPPSMTVNVGDHIVFNSIHRDMSMPCGFIPPLVTADSGPAQSTANISSANIPPATP